MISDKVAEIDWTQKKQLSHKELKKEYPSIIEKCTGATEIIFNFSFCQITQDVMNLFFKEAFFQPEHEEGIEENEGTKTEDEEQNKRYKYKRFLNLQKVSISIQSSCLTDVNFLATFFYFPNVKEIKLDCSDSSMAHFMLLAAKSHLNLEKVNCSDFFIKEEGKYKILSYPFFGDTLKSWIGIEEHIEVIKAQFQSDTYDSILEVIQKCTQLKKLECQLITLSENKKHGNHLIEFLSQNCKSLLELSLEVFQDDLLSPKIFSNLNKEIKVRVVYVYQILKKVSLINLLHYISFFVNNNYTIVFPNASGVEVSEKQLKLNFSSRTLHEDIDTKKDEFDELHRFLVSSLSKFESVILQFGSSQPFGIKKFVTLLKLICSQANIRRVEIAAARISQSVSALSLVKLVKSGKELAQVNASNYENRRLILNVHQINDQVMTQLLLNNCFIDGAMSIQDISINSDIVIGQLQPISNYLKNSNHAFLYNLKINILNTEYDLTPYFLGLLKDKNKINNHVMVFCFGQEGVKDKELRFQFFNNNLIVRLSPRYTVEETLKILNPLHLGLEFTKNLKNFLIPISTFTSAFSNISLEQVIKRFEILVQLRELSMVHLMNVFLPFQIETFYQIIAPVLPLNPQMIIADLYYN